MTLSRLFGGWIAVVVWLLLWELVGSRLGAARGDGKPVPRGRRASERPDPISIGISLLLLLRIVVAGGLLAWRLGPA